jgi:hypothetical protein
MAHGNVLISSDGIVSWQMLQLSLDVDSAKLSNAAAQDIEPGGQQHILRTYG